MHSLYMIISISVFVE